MELGLKGRAAVITGGSKGIGRAIARGLAAEGVNLVLLARGKEQLEKAAEGIAKESGVEVLAVVADIADGESLKAAAAAAKDRFGTIHIVVKNAGGPMRRMDRQITWPDTDWADDVNLKMIGMVQDVPDLKRTKRRILKGYGSASNFINCGYHARKHTAFDERRSHAVERR